jgi:hypothetical protein
MVCVVGLISSVAASNTGSNAPAAKLVAFPFLTGGYLASVANTAYPLDPFKFLFSENLLH